MQLAGPINMMKTSLVAGEAKYTLSIGSESVDMNALVGSHIELSFSQEITCSNCGNKTNKSFSQGYCFPCARSLARCDMCIMKPETCHHHLGTCREPEWGLANCFSSHIVYLANSSGIKVGITRKTNTPGRWIDQGAISALPILEVKTRLDSGKIEMALKSYVADKTNWRTMLKNEVEDVDLESKKNELLTEIPELINELQATRLEDETINIRYPVLKYPTKIVSLNFDKTPTISGVLEGIKGQYLLLDGGVLNLRKFSSYRLVLDS
ncbi:MAG: DUF2797 domain-containing protein [Thiotrichales bacterium]|jgi:hypothetical protein|nr:DUF2797 domain-containing protein [Thiotrichales bacterium]MBT3853972.1 DUF2797 domain-containing protein [Thiotrichales bacterium]MBT7439407.1 DUF2797 domain-containing protein [Thiotrichales bacterium]MBT7933351.1 DUF2797 domain-containing protein [Thiotrichales bacterium]